MVTVGSGAATASLSFTKCSSLNLTLATSSGTAVGSTSGASPVALSATLAAGTYVYTISGGRCSFTLTVTSATP